MIDRRVFLLAATACVAAFGLSHSRPGAGDYAHHASREEQIRVAEILRSRRGFAPWPTCARRLGLL